MKIKDIYQYCIDNDYRPLLPPITYDSESPKWSDFWAKTYDVSDDNVYQMYDIEFNRRYAGFEYFDVFHSNDETVADVAERFWYDVAALLQINQKKYQQMYRIFLATDAQMPFDYNYDMTEVYGATKTTSVYGSHTDTIGEVTDTHKVAPFNSTTPQTESQDVTAQRQDTIGTHTDTVDGQSVTNTRRGNIGVQTAADIAKTFTNYFTKDFKFVELIFEDICKQLLTVGD